MTSDVCFLVLFPIQYNFLTCHSSFVYFVAAIRKQMHLYGLGMNGVLRVYNQKKSITLPVKPHTKIRKFSFQTNVEKCAPSLKKV